jgi:hypothetical protein
MLEDDHSEPRDELDDDLPDSLHEVERMLALGRAFALCTSDQQRRELTLIHEWLKPYRGELLQ